MLKINPTVLKHVAHSLGLKGNIGKEPIAQAVRSNVVSFSNSTKSTDDVILSYFKTLKKPSVPKPKGKARNVEPRTTYRVDFSNDTFLLDPLDPSKECEPFLPWGFLPPEVRTYTDYKL